MFPTLLRVRSWQWLLIGLAVGAFGAVSVGWWGEPMLSAYGESINGQREFEDAVTRREGGTPRFTDLVVHAEQLHNCAGGARTVHVVSGMYVDGSPPQPGGGGRAPWRPAFFVAEVPYVPATNLARLHGGGGEAASRFAAKPQATVVDFLDLMRDARGVRFTHAWWRSPRAARVLWMLAGGVGVGVTWPITLNLITFGSVRRPVEVGTGLFNVSAPRAPAADGAAEPGAAMAELDGAIDELRHSAEAAAESAPAAGRVTAVARPMSTRPLEPVGITPAPDVKLFMADDGDFYPTEVRAAKEKPASRGA